MTRRNTRYEPPEVTALLNPAFISLLLLRAATACVGETGSALPLVYAPITVAIAAYPEVRSTLSYRINTPFIVWIERVGHLRSILQSRVQEFVPIVNEGLLFALAYEVLRLDGRGIEPGDRKSASQSIRGTADMRDAQRAAVYLGRWLPRAGGAATVCALLGVRP
jgi:Family of unknown function (DUF6521)